MRQLFFIRQRFSLARSCDIGLDPFLGLFAGHVLLRNVKVFHHENQLLGNRTQKLELFGAVAKRADLADRLAGKLNRKTPFLGRELLKIEILRDDGSFRRQQQAEQ